MMRVWLIAANVVREQRWFLLLMYAYIAGITTLLCFAERHDNDVLTIVKQEAVYGTFFSVVIAASLFRNELKTRRIIAVLSKAVRRSEYVAAAIIGVNLATVIFYVGVFASLFVLFPQAQFGSAAVMMLHMLVASLLASVVTVLFTTFMHPLVATVAAGLTLSVPLLLEKLAGSAWARVLPVISLTKHALTFSVGEPLRVDGSLLATAVVESVVLWLVASWIFARKDITTAVE